MSATKFWILIVMSLVIATLIGLEVLGTKRVSGLTDNIADLQTRMSKSLQQQEQLRALVQRIVNDSRNDPALAEMLARNGVKITQTPVPGASSPAPAPTPSPAPTGKPPKNP